MNDLLDKKGMGDYVDLKKDTELDLEKGFASEQEVELQNSDMNNGNAKKMKHKKAKSKKKRMRNKTADADLEMEDCQNHSLTIFFEEVDTVKREMEKVKQLLARLNVSHEESKSLHQAQAMKEVRKKMEDDVADVLKKVRSVKKMLEDLESANTENRTVDGFGPGTPFDRTRSSITNSLRKKLKSLMEDFQALREKIISEHRHTVERRFYTVTGQEADEGTIDIIIQTGESEGFMQKAIQSQGRSHILDTVREIQQRHDAVKDLERNLLELHQVFLDMAVLVESQGEQLDDIQHYVSQASAYMETGAKQLMSAKRYHKNSRKWMCLAIILLLIVLVVVVVPIATSFKSS